MRKRGLDRMVRDWYCGRFPDDPIGNAIGSGLTFRDFRDGVASGDGAGVVFGDDLIHDRVFGELALCA